ncbi:MAG: bile acid:sodium symporter family protein [Opitutaceae bacterium]
MKNRFDWFQAGLIAAMIVAWMAPAPGAAGGWLRPEYLTKGAVSLVFLLHGLRLPFSALRTGALNWRLHAIVQGTTFFVFPLVGIALYLALEGTMAPELRAGIVYLSVVPSTVSSSISLTAVARGNVAAAVFNATLSNLAGVLITPLWVALFLATTGTARPLGPVVFDLARWLLLPLAIGQGLRPFLSDWAGRHKVPLGVVDRLAVLLLVYTSFCDSFAGGIWSRQGPGAVGFIVLLSVVLLAAATLFTRWSARRAGLGREDQMTAVFCGSQKTIAAGVPMAKVIFGAHPALGVILLPLMIYHGLQLFAGGWLAQRWGRSD